MLEVCVDNLESAVNAIYGGADELELCSSLSSGGLTPSPGLVHKAMAVVAAYIDKTHLKRPKINILLRCRTGADFDYNLLEMETMLADISAFRTMGVDRFVFGCLNNMGKIDEQYNKSVVEKAWPIPVTFHRAYDVSAVTDPCDVLASLGFDRLLTSGKSNSVDDESAIAHIRDLVRKSGGRLQIMPGGGVECHNAQTYLEVGCKILHASCKTPVVKTQPATDLGFAVQTQYVTDRKKVEDLKMLIDEFTRNKQIEMEKKDT